MNEGVPIRTIATMIIATIIAAVIVGLIMVHFFTPPNYTYSAALTHSAALRAAAPFISIAAVG